MGLNVNSYLITMYVFVSLMVAWIIFYYAEAGTPWHTYMTVFLCYFSAFCILFMIPIDIARIIENRNYDGSDYISKYEDSVNLLRPIYKTFYLIVTIQANIVLIVEEMYNSDGYFNPFAKLLSTVKRYFYDNFPYMVVGGIVFGILVGQGVLGSSNSAILLTIILVSNTVNLLLLMFILGYGLIAYPQMLWNSADIDRSLKTAQQDAVSQYKHFNDCSVTISQIVADVRKTREQLSQYGDAKLNSAIEIILSECPSEFKSSTIGKVAVNKSGQITIDSLAELRMKLNQARDGYRLAQGQLEETKLTAYTCEDIANARNRKDGIKEIKWSFRSNPGKGLEYSWFLNIKPLLLRLAALGAVVLTILTFLGIIGSFKGVSEDASTFFVIVQSDSTTPVSVVFFILVTFGYLASITFWAMFQIKLSGSMEMVPFRTTPESLSFNARLVARLAAPMAFFYLGFIFENGTDNGYWVNSDYNTNTTFFDTTTNQTSYIISEDYEMLSAFAKFYQIQVVPSMGDAFNTFFPGLLIGVSFLVMTNVVNRLLVALHLEAYQFGQEIVTEEQMKDGKRVLERQKKVMARTVGRYNLKNAILGQTKRANEKESDIFEKTNEESQNTCWKRFISSLFSSSSGEGILETLDIADENKILKEPSEISGWVEKKGSKSFGMDGGWQKRYMVIKPPGLLQYWKDKDITKEPHGEVDLKLIVNFNSPTVKKGEAPRLDLELADKTFKMRFLTDDDSSYWLNGLKSWKTYALDYSTQPPEEEEFDDIFSSALKNEKQPQTDEDYDKIFNNISIPEDKSESFGLFGGKKKKTKEVQKEEVYTEKAPAPLEGWLEKKSHSAFANTYQKRYFKVNEATKSLEYAKSVKELESGPNRIDINQIVDVVQDSNDPSKFHMNIGEKVHKIKCENKADAEKWIKGINDWRDYLILKMV